MPLDNSESVPASASGPNVLGTYICDAEISPNDRLIVSGHGDAFNEGRAFIEVSNFETLDVLDSDGDAEDAWSTISLDEEKALDLAETIIRFFEDR